ncbi:MAG: transcriptional regulator [Rickettsiales bacterium]|jgi:putative transcriptional regulator|nr:transcriptional regulator [Rickettsiales bacterium]
MGQSHSANNNSFSSLEGSLLLATPRLNDSCFEKAVIYICAHSSQGAMGLVINHVLPHVDCKDLLTQLRIDSDLVVKDLPVCFGGPVDTNKGFILHSDDYSQAETVELGNALCITSNIAALKDLISGHGPTRSILALGYAGWGAGQLEKEIKDNSWFTGTATEGIIFDVPPGEKWYEAMGSLGLHQVTACNILNIAGHA